MNINERIVYNLLKHLDKMNNNPEFKEKCSNITAQEYLYAKVHDSIKLKRLINILNGKVNRITTYELIYISKALNIKVSDLVR